MAATPDQQRDYIKKVFAYPLIREKGQEVFVLNVKWFEAWKQYVNFDEDDDVDPSTLDTPGEIDNSPLCVNGENWRSNPSGDDYLIHKSCRENIDHIFVAAEAWKGFYTWYKGGPILPRKVITSGVSEQLVIELHPLVLRTRVILSSGPSATVPLIVSKTTSTNEVYDMILMSFDITEGSSKLWKVEGDDETDEGKYILMDMRAEKRDDDDDDGGGSGGGDSDDEGVMEVSLEDAAIFDDQLLVVEVADPTGAWVRAEEAGEDPARNAVQVVYPSSERALVLVGSPDSPGDRSFAFNPSASGGVGGGGTPALGRVGLRNIGNTCYMNSTLQCLSNTEMLTQYFLSPQWMYELNKTNFLGTGGLLAQQYASWVGEMWVGPARTVTPANLKQTIGKFCPTFAGYQQHDSQELLNYLLDGLHEDLNRVKERPSTEKLESDGTQPDSEVAAEAWRRHVLRNSSVIVDYMHGQYKSTVVCPTCHRTSVTFDPFAVLSVPMPAEVEDTGVTVNFIPANGAPPTTYRVLVKPGENVAAMKTQLCELVADPAVREGNLVMGDVYVNRMYTILDDRKLASSFRSFDTVNAFECVAVPDGVKAGLLSLIHRTKYMGSFMRTGGPLVVRYLETQTVREVKDMITAAVNRLSAVPITEAPYDLMIVDKDAYRPGSLWGEADDMPMKESSLLLTPVSYLALNWKSIGEKTTFNEKEAAVKATHRSAQPQPPLTITLEACLNRYSETEQLTAGNEWYCSKCQAHVLATKTISPWRLPDNLVIHLKRFQREGQFGFVGRKLTDAVKYPATLDMSQWLPEAAKDPAVDNVYELYAVSLHGGSLHFGHYTAHAKNNGEWWHFNDSSAHPTTEAAVLNDGAAAYVLFYKRRNPVHAPVNTGIRKETSSEDENEAGKGKGPAPGQDGPTC